MTNPITCIERFILEILEYEPKSIDQIEVDTGLTKKIVLTVLNDLTAMDIVEYSKGCFKVKENQEILKLNSSEQINLEKQELAKASILNQSKPLNVKKIKISQRDEVFLNGLLSQINSFIENLKYSKTEKLTSKVIFWGEDNYEHLCKATISY